MRNLSTLLDKISRSLNKDKFTREAIISTVSKVANIHVKEESIQVREGVLELTTTPVIKSEISFKEKEILNALRNEYGVYISKILYH